jgi:hypothetical protein
VLHVASCFRNKPYLPCCLHQPCFGTDNHRCFWGSVMLLRMCSQAERQKEGKNPNCKLATKLYLAEIIRMATTAPSRKSFPAQDYGSCYEKQCHDHEQNAFSNVIHEVKKAVCMMCRFCHWISFSLHTCKSSSMYWLCWNLICF